MKRKNIKNETHSVVKTEGVFKWWDYPIFILLTALSLATILYFLSYWFSHRDWLYYPITFSIITFILIVILSNNQLRWLLLLCMRRPKPVRARNGWKVGVTTTFVPGAESLKMLEETVRALIAMDYAHETWVLDEGDDDQVKALCRELGANHFSRKNLPRYQTETGIFQSRSKHGNYNAWLYEIGFDRYDIIASFDPDHVPDPDFLSTVLGYFEDPKIGYVQAAQVYYNQKASFIASGAAEETYAYYSSIQMGSYGMGYPIVTGCHNTHRVIALKQVGGFAPHDADDLLITLLYRARGRKGIYLPQILATGLTPVDWSGYLTQQRRWACSVIDIKFRIYPKLARNLPFKTCLMSFFHGFNYVQDSLITSIGLMLMIFMLATGITPVVFSHLTVPKLALVLAVLQLCDFYRQRFYLDWKREWGLHWRAGLVQFAKWPYVLLALCEAVSGRRVPYSLTLKVKANPRQRRLFWPHVFVVTLIGTAWIVGMVSGRIMNPLLHTCAAIIAIGSLGLILMERLNFPDPYDKALSSLARSQRVVNK